jgi:lysyl endopeptidase
MKTSIRLLACSALIVALAPAIAYSRGPATFDQYGYQIHDSTGAQCSYNYVDASGGALLGLTASGAALAPDDGGSVVNLGAPFEFYGNATSTLVASTNGYLAAASSLAEEDGGDFSNDCPLPALADNAAAMQARIMVYHDELDGTGSGNMHYQYFSNCPRAAESGVSEACSVVAWDQWTRIGSSGALAFEAVLYHTSFEIALQYQSLDASAGNAASIGLQNSSATSAAIHGCNGSKVLSAPTAVCFFDPRSPQDTIFSNGFE